MNPINIILDDDAGDEPEVPPFTVHFTVQTPSEFADGVFNASAALHQHVGKHLGLVSNMNYEDKEAIIVATLAGLIDDVCDDKQSMVQLLKQLSLALLQSDETKVIPITPENGHEFVAAVDAAKEAGGGHVDWEGQEIPLDVAEAAAAMVRTALANDGADKPTTH